MTDHLPGGVPKYQIFPAIGIARVGDSRHHTYVAHEAPQINFVPPGGYRGPEELSIVKPAATDPLPAPMMRRLKRMGCRFRIYEFNADGIPVKEINSSNADIEWRVRLVNKKATGNTDRGFGLESTVLNPNMDESDLTIDSLEQSVTGTNQGPLELAGQVVSRVVKLGDLETDRQGRLIVFGGHGVADSWHDPSVAPNRIRNPGWFDDTSDGSVKATLVINGSTHEALSARVVVGPPDYVHPCLAPVTLFDLAFDRKGGHHFGFGIPLPRTSMTRDIHPILHRAAFLEWTLFAISGSDYGRTPKHGHGVTSNHDMHPHGGFLDPDIFGSIQVKDPTHPDYPDGSFRREMYFSYLKDPSSPPPPFDQRFGNSMPAIEGLSLTSVQYEYFRALANEDFDADWPAGQDPATRVQPPLKDISVAARPEAHNRAAMDFAVGGPFLPGVEIGAIAAEETTYTTIEHMDSMINFRISDDVPEGDLTQTLAVPWQTAFNQHNCPASDDNDSADNLWPSARPVLVSAKKSGVSDDLLWTRPFTNVATGDRFENQKMRANQQMIDHWSELGFIAPVPFYMEISRTLPEDPDEPI